MLRRLGLLLVAIAWFAIAGGHWAVAQTIAWAEMLRDYTAQTGSVAEAVEQTFDGQHPCELCLQIAAAKRAEAEAKSPSSKSTSNERLAKVDKQSKAVVPDDLLSVCIVDFMSFNLSQWVSTRASARDERPPTPPPRADLA